MIAHEKFQLHDPHDGPDDDTDDGDIPVGFADGSVAAVATKEAAALIEKSKDRLAAIKPLKRYAREPAD